MVQKKKKCHSDSNVMESRKILQTDTLFVKEILKWLVLCTDNVLFDLFFGRSMFDHLCGEVIK